MRILARLPFRVLILALAVAPLLVACGNKGPLVLPDPATQADKDKDKKKAPPPAPAPAPIPPPASGSGTR